MSEFDAIITSDAVDAIAGDGLKKKAVVAAIRAAAVVKLKMLFLAIWNNDLVADGVGERKFPSFWLSSHFWLIECNEVDEDECVDDDEMKFVWGCDKGLATMYLPDDGLQNLLVCKNDFKHPLLA